MPKLATTIRLFVIDIPLMEMLRDGASLMTRQFRSGTSNRILKDTFGAKQTVSMTAMGNITLLKSIRNAYLLFYEHRFKGSIEASTSDCSNESGKNMESLNEGTNSQEYVKEHLIMAPALRTEVQITNDLLSICESLRRVFQICKSAILTTICIFCEGCELPRLPTATTYFGNHQLAKRA